MQIPDSSGPLFSTCKTVNNDSYLERVVGLILPVNNGHPAKRVFYAMTEVNHEYDEQDEADAQASF